MTSKKPRKTRTGVDHTTVIPKLVGIALDHGTSEIEVQNCTGRGQLRGVAHPMEGQGTGTSTRNGIKNTKIETQVDRGGEAVVLNDLTRVAPGMFARETEALPQQRLRHRRRRVSATPSGRRRRATERDPLVIGRSGCRDSSRMGNMRRRRAERDLDSEPSANGDPVAIRHQQITTLDRMLDTGTRHSRKGVQNAITLRQHSNIGNFKIVHLPGFANKMHTSNPDCKRVRGTICRGDSRRRRRIRHTQKVVNRRHNERRSLRIDKSNGAKEAVTNNRLVHVGTVVFTTSGDEVSGTTNGRHEFFHLIRLGKAIRRNRLRGRRSSRRRSSG